MASYGNKTLEQWSQELFDRTGFREWQPQWGESRFLKAHAAREARTKKYDASRLRRKAKIDQAKSEKLQREATQAAALADEGFVAHNGKLHDLSEADEELTPEEYDLQYGAK